MHLTILDWLSIPAPIPSPKLPITPSGDASFAATRPHTPSLHCPAVVGAQRQRLVKDKGQQGRIESSDVLIEF